VLFERDDAHGRYSSVVAPGLSHPEWRFRKRGAIAIGNGVSVGRDNAVAIDNGSSANFSKSAAIGNGAVATRANQQVYGTASNTYTMASIGSAASRAAQSGPTQLVTAGGAGNLAATTLSSLGLASTADVNAINAQLAGINGQINDLYGRTSKAFTGVAMRSPWPACRRSCRRKNLRRR
jgi:hypothetical protein